jgi:hypothetical protein
MTNIAFDEATHSYWIDGKKATSVTESLKLAGLIDGIQFASEEALWRGKAVHAAIHFYHKGTLNWDSLDERLVPFVRGYLKFIEDTGFVPEEWEKRVSIPHLILCGTLDVIGVLPDGSRALIDFKTGLQANMGEWVGLQLALYDMAMGLVTPARKRYGLKLMGENNYRLFPFTDPMDYTVALSAVNIANWRIRRHGKDTGQTSRNQDNQPLPH